MQESHVVIQPAAEVVKMPPAEVVKKPPTRSTRTLAMYFAVAMGAAFFVSLGGNIALTMALLGKEVESDTGVLKLKGTDQTIKVGSTEFALANSTVDVDSAQLVAEGTGGLIVATAQAQHEFPVYVTPYLPVEMLDSVKSLELTYYNPEENEIVTRFFKVNDIELINATAFKIFVDVGVFACINGNGMLILTKGPNALKLGDNLWEFENLDLDAFEGTNGTDAYMSMLNANDEASDAFGEFMVDYKNATLEELEAPVEHFPLEVKRGQLHVATMEHNATVFEYIEGMALAALEMEVGEGVVTMHNARALRVAADNSVVAVVRRKMFIVSLIAGTVVRYFVRKAMTYAVKAAIRAAGRQLMRAGLKNLGKYVKKYGYKVYNCVVNGKGRECKTYQRFENGVLEVYEMYKDHNNNWRIVSQYEAGGDSASTSGAARYCGGSYGSCNCEGNNLWCMDLRAKGSREQSSTMKSRGHGYCGNSKYYIDRSSANYDCAYADSGSIMDAYYSIPVDEFDHHSSYTGYSSGGASSSSSSCTDTKPPNDWYHNTCYRQKRYNKCAENKQYGYCQKTCGYCSTSSSSSSSSSYSSCTDTKPPNDWYHNTCYRQKRYNKCAENRQYGYCKKTCGYC